MKNDKKTNSFVKLLKSMFEPKKSSEKTSKPKYQPSWMYRNE